MGNYTFLLPPFKITRLLRKGFRGGVWDFFFFSLPELVLTDFFKQIFFCSASRDPRQCERSRVSYASHEGLNILLCTAFPDFLVATLISGWNKGMQKHSRETKSQKNFDKTLLLANSPPHPFGASCLRKYLCFCNVREGNETREAKHELCM